MTIQRDFFENILMETMEVGSAGFCQDFDFGGFMV